MEFKEFRLDGFPLQKTQEVDGVTYKLCSKCKTYKPFTQYYPTKKGLYGLKAECKKCAITRSQKWQKDNPQLVNKNAKRWRDDNKDKTKSYNRAYRKKGET